MKNVVTKGTYWSPNLQICEIDEQDVVRTSNGAEVDYQQQGWGSSTVGFDNPFN